MDAGRLTLSGEPETIVSGFPEQRQHAVKPMTFDDAGNMYVNVGGPSNACQEEARKEGSPGQNPCPQREWQASIWRFAADAPGQTQQSDGYRFASGIRNSVAIAWDPAIAARNLDPLPLLEFPGAGVLIVVQHRADRRCTPPFPFVLRSLARRWDPVFVQLARDTG